MTPTRLLSPIWMTRTSLRTINHLPRKKVKKHLSPAKEPVYELADGGLDFLGTK
jgi:hypothetical protein